MDYVILEPVDIAEHCFLFEALMWVGFHRIPIKFMENEKEARFDPNYIEEYRAESIGSGGHRFEMVTDDECVFANIPINPNYEYCWNDISDSATLKRLISSDILSEQEKKEYKIELIEATQRDKDQIQWDIEYEKYIAIAKSKIFIALAEGKITAFGRSLPVQDFDKSIDELSCILEMPNLDWHDIEYSKIPANFWQPHVFKWEDSAAKDGVSHFMHIYFKVSELIELFPFSESYLPQKVSFVSGHYLLDDEEGSKSKGRVTSTRGRPQSYAWDQFHVEVARRLQNNEVPNKQDSFIHEMTLWCEKTWEKSPSLTSIKQKVSPYYKEFIRKKSEKK